MWGWMNRINERQNMRDLHVHLLYYLSGVAGFILSDACTGPDVFGVAGKWLRKHGTIPTCTFHKCKVLGPMRHGGLKDIT